MPFTLVDCGWDQVLNAAVQADRQKVRIICPFIKKKTVERLLCHGIPERLEVITRFNLAEFCESVSDIAALRRLLSVGAQIRGIKHLHAKVYLFGNSRAIGTSANLTEAALTRNCEFGFVADEAPLVSRCHAYFNDLWKKASATLTAEMLTDWESQIVAVQLRGAPPSQTVKLPDFGADVGLQPESTLRGHLDAPEGQAFVKFFGSANNRVPLDRRVFDIVKSAGCHWACTYPKAPRQVKDGAIMFLARLSKGPDIHIFGRATGLAYVEGRDKATAADIKLRGWKEKWPYYSRVYDAEFVAGTLGNGISLYQLMDELGSDAFAVTQRNARRGNGNTDPRMVYRRQPAVRLSRKGFRWLNDRLQGAFERHGTIPAADIATLDPPGLPYSK